jgi:hypothetical protein
LTAPIFDEKLVGKGDSHHMKYTWLASTLFLGFGAVGCGGSDLDPGAGDDPGTGTSTLTVDGSVSANPRLSNARNAGEFDTEFSVRLQLNGQNVTTGTVTMTSSSGTVVLAYSQDNNGRWRGVAAGYDEVYILDVDSGTDNVHDVRVDGPDIHTFTEPLAGATVDATMPLMVKWDSGQDADSAAIDAENIDRLSIPDSGSKELPALALKSEKDKPKENQLRLTRTNRVVPAGAAGGSELSVSVENELTVVAQANPGL